MPKSIVYLLLCLMTLLLIPPAAIAYKRATLSEKPRIHYVQDMDNQLRFKAQQSSEFFLDGRAMRPPVDGAVARGHLNDDVHLHRGLTGDPDDPNTTWVNTLPDGMEWSRSFIERGEERFNIFCSMCHGQTGYGDGIVHERAMRLMNAGKNGTTWVQPKSLHEAAIVEQPLGQIFNTITNGARTMAGYKAQIPVEDRWAIVAYVEALQRSQNARLSDVDSNARNALPVERLPEDQRPQGSGS